MRELRSYERVACKEHLCDYCFHPISPGSLYQGVVYASRRHIFDLKEHRNPYCPVDPDDYADEMLRDRDATIDKLVINEIIKKEAA